MDGYPTAKRAEWFEKAVAKHLLAQALDTGRNNGLIRGSSLGVKCLRRLGYMVLGYAEQPRTAHAQYVLNFGNAFHDMVQAWMAQMGLVKAKPFLSKEGHMLWKGDAEGTILDVEDGIIGHFDGLTQPVALPDNIIPVIGKKGKRYLLEFKTITNKNKVHAIYYQKINGTEYTVKYRVPEGCDLDSDLPRLEGSPPKRLDSRGNEKYFERVDAARKAGFPFESGTLLDVVNKPGQFLELSKPKEEHVLQATYYASRLKADAILIIYLAKDCDEQSYAHESILNIPIKAFEVDVSEEIILSIKRKTSALWSCLEEGEKRGGEPETWLPPRPYNPDDRFSECKFCPYVYTCYPDSDLARGAVARKFEEQALINLKVAEGKPFELHSNWGRAAAKNGLVQDVH